MDGIHEAWDIVFGEGEFEKLVMKFVKAGIIAGSLILLFIIILLWRIIACKKIKKAMLSVSERPSSETADKLIHTLKHLTPIGRFLARCGFRFAHLSKGDCMNIYNITILLSDNITLEQKEIIGKQLKRIGCRGLTAIDHENAGASNG